MARVGGNVSRFTPVVEFFDYYVLVEYVVAVTVHIDIIPTANGVGKEYHQGPVAPAYCVAHTSAEVRLLVVLAEQHPVVVGETVTYGYEHIITAMNLVNKGARLIATNTDIIGPIEGGIAPACRAFVAPIEATTGKKAYYVGKPNPLMMRTGLQILGVHSSEAVMIGDRMDTDIIAGIETGLDTALVLSGVSTRATIKEFPYRPRLILNGVGDIAI